jgi:hypothetical protein
MIFCVRIVLLIDLSHCPVLECVVRVADETSNRTIECPVSAQMINQSYILIIKFINECELVVRIADAMLSRVLINTRTLTQNVQCFIINSLRVMLLLGFIIEILKTFVTFAQQ